MFLYCCPCHSCQLGEWFSNFLVPLFMGQRRADIYHAAELCQPSARDASCVMQMHHAFLYKYQGMPSTSILRTFSSATFLWVLLMLCAVCLQVRNMDRADMTSKSSRTRYARILWLHFICPGIHFCPLPVHLCPASLPTLLSSVKTEHVLPSARDSCKHDAFFYTHQRMPLTSILRTYLGLFLVSTLMLKCAVCLQVRNMD